MRGNERGRKAVLECSNQQITLTTQKQKQTRTTMNARIAALCDIVWGEEPCV